MLTSISIFQLKNILEGLFGAQCPDYFFTGPAGARAEFSDDFESDRNSKETEPFCGRYSAKNPRRMFVKGENDIGIALAQFSQVCLN